jgi:hypothetical protein
MQFIAPEFAPGDELYPNEIFEFNITKMLAFLKANTELSANVTAINNIKQYVTNYLKIIALSHDLAHAMRSYEIISFESRARL